MNNLKTYRDLELILTFNLLKEMQKTPMSMQIRWSEGWTTLQYNNMSEQIAHPLDHILDAIQVRNLYVQ